MTAPEPSLSIAQTDGGIAVSGEIDAHTAPRVTDAIEAFDGPVLDLDMSGVNFVDSSGLRVLVQAHQRLAGAGRELRLVAASPAVKRLLEISGVDEYLDVR